VFLVKVAFQIGVEPPLVRRRAAYRHTAASLEGRSFMSVQSSRQLSQRY
jgi:hypothetical protein